MHVVLLKLSNRFRISLIWKGLTVVWFLLVRYSVSGKREEHEECHTDKLPMYRLSSSLFMPLSDSLRMISTIRAHQKNNFVAQSYSFVFEAFGQISTRRIPSGGLIIKNVEVLFCIGIVLLRHL